MKTEVIMKRELFGKEIGQKSKSEFLSATDLVKAANIWRKDEGLSPFNMTAFLNQKGTKEFMDELERSEGCNVIVKGRGRNAQTWVHPLLFIDMAFAVNPKLKIEVYKWLHDLLLRSRDRSGDSYKEMCGSLFAHEKDKSLFNKRIRILASKIKEICSVSDWQEANEKQLILRDKIHKNISLLSNVLRNNDKAIELGIREALKDERLD